MDSAHARAATLTRLADAIAARRCVIDVGRLLQRHPPDGDLPAAYAAQERAAVGIAQHLDEARDRVHAPIGGGDIPLHHPTST